MAIVSFEIDNKQFNKVISLVNAVEPAIERASVGGMYSVANFYRVKAREYIENEFRTDNSLSQNFRKRATFGKSLSGDPFKRRFLRSKKAFDFMGALVRFQVFPRSNQIVLGFGTGQNQFDKKLMEIGTLMQTGYSIKVTPEMRRAIALTDEIFLKKTTTEIKVKPRPVFDIVAGQFQNEAIEIYREKTMRSFSQQLDRIA